jgi:LPS-assembly lipoprotein
MRRRQLLVWAVGTSLSGCGFRPVYMPTASGSAGVAQRELAAIHVDTIPDRPGQLLRQALQQRFQMSDNDTASQYDLSVSFGISGEGIAVQPNSIPTRIRNIGTANWTLIALDPGRTHLTSGTARAVNGVNLFDTQYFAADLETETVTRQIANQVADQITVQLATYFRKRAATSS